MNKTINLGLGVELDIVDTDFAKSFHLRNEETKHKIDLGIRLK